MSSPLLQIRNATKIYSSSGFLGRAPKTVVALDDFNMTINHKPATITTIAGESGSGKTTLANLVLGFIRLTSGSIIYDGRDVTNMDDYELLEYRRNVQAVFQDPFGVYNPFYRIEHVFDLVNKHFNLSDNKTEFQDMVEEGLNVVGLQGVDVLRKYPHQLSGGQRQRIMMARAYMIKPRLIVADEPVSMVDASLRASILDAMLRLRDQSGISFLYITHDLSTAYQIGDQIYMLYQGTIAERGDAMGVIDEPKHPYVQLLIDSVPVPDPTEKWDVDISLPSEEEMRTAAAKGCRYYPRCPHRMDKCLVEHPPLYKLDAEGHEASCYLYDENEIAPLEAPVIIDSSPSTRPSARRKSRTPQVAMFAVIAIVAIGLLLLATGGNDGASDDTPTEDGVEENVASDDVTPDTEDDGVGTAGTDDNGEQQEPSVVLTMDDAIDRGTLELGTVSDPSEITAEDEKHSYTFEGTAGQTIRLQVNARGSAFTSPYGFLYDPDGTFIIASGDTTRRTRSMRIEQMLDKDGTYTIVVGPVEGNGIEEYEVMVEEVAGTTNDSETEPTEATDTSETESQPEPSVILTIDGATETGTLEFGTPFPSEITSEDEKQSFTFEGEADTTILFKVNATGSAFTSPYGFLFSPDGEFIVASGDPTRRTRSMRIEQALEADGTYTIVVGPVEGNGIEEYEVTVELVEE